MAETGFDEKRYRKRRAENFEVKAEWRDDVDFGTTVAVEYTTNSHQHFVVELYPDEWLETIDVVANLIAERENG